MPTDLSRIRHIVLDMDGTIYLGGTLFPFTKPFLADLAGLGIGHSYVTNNCSKSRKEYIKKLHAIGIEASPESLTTSAHATIHHLRTSLPNARRLYVLGTPGLDSEFREAGFEVVNDRPDAVIVGFDTDLHYKRLCETAYWIAQGLPYIATHPDRVCPTDQPTILPDCGAICALLESATGRCPDAVPGKPDAGMLEAVRHSHQLAAHEIAMVGDRLYTDVRMAKAAGAVGVLTLTGETTRADVDNAEECDKPDLVIRDLTELATLLKEARHVC